MLFLLVAVAFATLFIPMPRWLSALLSFLFVGLGLLMVLFGWMGSYWDDHMRPNADSAATPILRTGLLLLLSQAMAAVRWVLEVLMSPPAP